MRFGRGEETRGNEKSDLCVHTSTPLLYNWSSWPENTV